MHLTGRGLAHDQPRERVLVSGNPSRDGSRELYLRVLDRPYDGLRYDLRPIIAAAHAKGIKILFDYAMVHVHKDSGIFQQRPQWRADAAIGKTVVSSGLIDRVSRKLGRRLYEVPVGFKYFAAGLFDGSLGFGGEESAGASFLRKDGTVWTTDKDGIILALLASEIIAVTGKTPSALYKELTVRFGDPAYARVDAAADREAKARLGKLSGDDITATELAGDPIIAKLSHAPGNGEAIGGVKVETEFAWFAARPSGTEDVYKIYAESFKGPEHLKLVQAGRLGDRRLHLPQVEVGGVIARRHIVAGRDQPQVDEVGGDVGNERVGLVLGIADRQVPLAAEPDEFRVREGVVAHLDAGRARWRPEAQRALHALLQRPARLAGFGEEAREFGPVAAVLLGDALFAPALHLATQFPTTEICAAVSESTRRVCAGEIVQTLRRGSLNITLADYQRIIDLKTAELFRVSCFLGAKLSGAEPTCVEAAARFGRHLGIAYQIYDDLADYFGNEARIGKTLGTDLASGKLTLPLITLSERLPADERQTLTEEITGKRPPQLALRLQQMNDLGVFAAVNAAVHAELATATAALAPWPNYPATPHLLALGEAHQPGVDEHARELRADGLVDQGYRQKLNNTYR